MPRKSKPDRRPVCFGTINCCEWHVDFSLVPRGKRLAAANIFRDAVNTLDPAFPERPGTAMIFNHAAGEVETMPLPRRKHLEIGMTVK